MENTGGDVRANPKLSGTTHNVFGIQTGVAISFMVKKVSATKEKRPARVHYVRRPEMETAAEKISYLAAHPIRDLEFDQVQPDKSHNWVNLTSNDFDTLIPLASKETKGAKTASKERAIFKLFSLGVSTNRDEWVYDDDPLCLEDKVRWMLEHDGLKPTGGEWSDSVKWSETLKRRIASGAAEAFSQERLRAASYRPYVGRYLYASNLLVDRPSELAAIPNRGQSICLSFGKNFRVLASGAPFDLHFIGDTVGLPFQRLGPESHKFDNITDWAFKQFTAHYANHLASTINTERCHARLEGVHVDTDFSIDNDHAGWWGPFGGVHWSPTPAAPKSKLPPRCQHLQF